LGAALGSAAAAWLPSAGIDVRAAALVGMAAMFAGASRALLATVLFAFEATRQPLGLLPLLGGCTMSFVLSSVLMRHTIMTEKIARRGRKVPSEYLADPLEQVHALAFASREVVSLGVSDSLEETRRHLASGDPAFRFQGFPVLNERSELVGMVTRRDLFEGEVAPGEQVGSRIRKGVVAIDENGTLRHAARLMAAERVGRLPVVSSSDPKRVCGILSRRDLLHAYPKELMPSKPSRA
jgi:CBS domain-containing protein